MIKIYVKFLTSSEGDSPRKLVDRLRRIGGVPLIGEYDIEIPLGEKERLFHKLEAIHRALKGSKALYSVATGVEGVGIQTAELPLSDRKNVELKKKFYRAKLSRWREMGIDTRFLEEVLDKDIDKFKDLSKAYIRDHLNKGKIVESAPGDLKKIDEDIFTSIDDLGVSLKSLRKLTGLQENGVVLSLGRLISAGKVRRIKKGGEEVYIRAKKRARPKTAPEVIPAKSEAEAIQRVLSSIRTKGSTLNQLSRDSRLPEGQVMDALAELLKTKRLRSAKRGRGTVYLRVPGK